MSYSSPALSILINIRRTVRALKRGTLATASQNVKRAALVGHFSKT